MSLGTYASIRGIVDHANINILLNVEPTDNEISIHSGTGLMQKLSGKVKKVSSRAESPLKSPAT